MASTRVVPGLAGQSLVSRRSLKSHQGRVGRRRSRMRTQARSAPVVDVQDGEITGITWRPFFRETRKSLSSVNTGWQPIRGSANS